MLQLKLLSSVQNGTSMDSDLDYTVADFVFDVIQIMGACTGMYLFFTALDIYYSQPFIRKLIATDLLPYDPAEVWGSKTPSSPRPTRMPPSSAGDAQSEPSARGPTLNFYAWLLDHPEAFLLHNLYLASLSGGCVLGILLLALYLPDSVGCQWILFAGVLSLTAWKLLDIAIPLKPDELCIWWLFPPSYVFITHLCVEFSLDVGRYFFKSKRSRYFSFLLEGRREPLRLTGGGLIEEPRKKRRLKVRLNSEIPPLYTQCLNKAPNQQIPRTRESELRKGSK
ncbi:MAG: hypothetical protein M1835_004168 [Candelina submexicana]|nr:MAG: hypothetical protein M1835_004168 [Candelina submexicana]